MGQQQIQKQAPTKAKTEDAPPVPKSSESAKAASKDAADLIDEIDAVLEENATEFVANYVQRGGQ